jgi:hypothetical protein
MPSTVFSGFDGEHTFQVPIAVYDADGDVELTADDPSAVAFERTTLSKPVNADGIIDAGAYFLLTMKKAGTFTLTASSSGRTAKASIRSTAYDAARWSAGKQRYESGANGDPPCTRCHSGGQAIDHSPATMASAQDQEIGFIITTGTKPGPNPIGDLSCSDCTAKGKKHQWSVSDEERNGLIAYLRSLAPRGFE